MSSEGQRRSRKPPNERAAEVRRAAVDIARADGLYAVTLRAVAKRVGVTSALVSHYEPNMDALVAATFTTVVHSELLEVQSQCAAQQTPTEAMRWLVTRLPDQSRNETTAVWLDSWSLGRRIGVISDAVREQMDAWQDFVVGIVQRGVDVGEFTTDEPDAVAWQLLGMIDGLNAQSLVHYRDTTSRSRLLGSAMEHELGLPLGALAR